MMVTRFCENYNRNVDPYDPLRTDLVLKAVSKVDIIHPVTRNAQTQQSIGIFLANDTFLVFNRGNWIQKLVEFLRWHWLIRFISNWHGMAWLRGAFLDECCAILCETIAVKILNSNQNNENLSSRFLSAIKLMNMALHTSAKTFFPSLKPKCQQTSTPVRSKLLMLIWQIYDATRLRIIYHRTCGVSLPKQSQSKCATEITASRIIFPIFTTYNLLLPR